MKTMKRILPVICITLAVLIISFLLYSEIMRLEEKRCWQELGTTAQTVKREITTKFEDEIVKLHLIETMMLEDDYLDVESIERLHIDMLEPTTIFSRIDVLYPDNILVSNGIKHSVEHSIDYEQLKEKGEYLTSRRTDEQTGKECVYYVLPVVKDDEIRAVIIGVIDAMGLAEIFQPLIYNGEANVCIIDADDGAYIMDSWHDTLENLYAQTEREKLKEYEHIDLQDEMKNLRTGTIAFVSRTTGKPLYMYYMPMDIHNWQLAIFVQESVVFKYLFSIQKLFVLVGITEVILLVLYFGWNIRTVKQLERSNAEISRRKEQLKRISYKDMLTSMYNRNKYTEVKNALREKLLENVGIIYMDLNGLKQINDSQMHEAGDRYICNAAHVILNVFDEKSYRIGGDEFVVLADGIEQAEFMEKVTVLQENMKKEKISISIGIAWKEKCEDLGNLLKCAEEEMYKDKDAYYLTHKKKR